MTFLIKMGRSACSLSTEDTHISTPHLDEDANLFLSSFLTASVFSGSGNIVIGKFILEAGKGILD